MGTTVLCDSIPSFNLVPKPSDPSGFYRSRFLKPCIGPFYAALLVCIVFLANEIVHSAPDLCYPYDRIRIISVIYLYDRVSCDPSSPHKLTVYAKMTLKFLRFLHPEFLDSVTCTTIPSLLLVKFKEYSCLGFTPDLLGFRRKRVRCTV